MYVCRREVESNAITIPITQTLFYFCGLTLPVMSHIMSLLLRNFSLTRTMDQNGQEAHLA